MTASTRPQVFVMGILIQHQSMAVDKRHKEISFRVSNASKRRSVANPDGLSGYT